MAAVNLRLSVRYIWINPTLEELRLIQTDRSTSKLRAGLV